MKIETKRKIAMIGALVLVALAIASQIYVLVKETRVLANVMNYVTMSISMIALLSSCIYIGTEFKKSSVKYFKLFLFVFVLAQLSGVIGVIVNGESLAIILGRVFIVGLLNVILWVKDLGKTNSLYVAGAVLFSNLLLCVVFIFKSAEILGAGTEFVAFLLGLTHIALSVVLFVMILLKYYDKQMRNTK